MTTKVKLSIEMSEKRERLNALMLKDELDHRGTRGTGPADQAAPGVRS